MSYYNCHKEDEKIVLRAISAMFRQGGPGTRIPANYSGITTFKEKKYVVLANAGGVLAVYRVRNDDKLKGLKRWPKGIEKGFV